MGEELTKPGTQPGSRAAAGVWRSKLIAVSHSLRTFDQDFTVLVFATDAEASRAFEQIEKFSGREVTNEFVTLIPGFVQAGVFRFESARKLISKRISALHRLASGSAHVVVTSVRGLARFFPRPEWVASHSYLLKVGDALELEDCVRRLETIGFLEVQSVEEVGDFAVRGAILDVWIPGNSYPHRVEFFGDQVESMRIFRPADQRSFLETESLVLLPCREFSWPEGQDLERAIESLNDVSLNQRLTGSVRADLFENLRNAVPFPGIDDACAMLFQSHYCPGIEHLERIAAKINRKLRFDFVCDESEFDEALRSDFVLYEKFEQTARNKGYLFSPFQKVFCGIDQLKAQFIAAKKADQQSASTGPRSESFPTFQKFEASYALPEELRTVLNADACRKAKGRLEALLHLTSHSLVQQVFVGLKDSGAVSDLVGYMSHVFPDLLSDAAVHAPLAEGLPALFFAKEPAPLRKYPLLFAGDIGEPFYSENSKILVVSESWLRGLAAPSAERAPSLSELAGQDSGAAAQNKLSSKSNAEILLQAQYSEFNEGDPVVHVLYGVGRFLGLATVTVGDASGDFLVIEYAAKDKIYVPVDKLNLVQRYISASPSDTVVLDSLKSQAWEKKKEKARKDAEKIARQLLEHQAKRETSPGHAFSRHEEEMMAFEAAFPFDETPDQIKTGREIAEDMCAMKSMDRLLCGDVGFGKTEVAMRAAYRAILDGKQVAWLVPTTVLAHQHFRSACERFSGFGVSVSLLDRSASKGLKASLADLAAGKIDLLIGTHRILSEDVQFKSLGLLVVDEEQRFGVLQKERIKNMSYGVDVLTMTATPIPRTLQLAMLGLRDLSLLTTPPKARLAVKTFVSPFDDEIIKQALESELARGGQTFFVHNRVEDLPSVHDFLQKLVPSIRITIGHGQMGQKELDTKIIDFLDGKFDLLLCTTIIESGIDMPRVNTIIIQNADHFGLSQLYQLRGRVGRRSSRGFAYFLLSPGLTEKDDGYKRVEILKEHQGLGSGFIIASHDLEMRGAGNIVGDDQSGRMNEVGFETYNQMLDDAVKALGGVKAVVQKDVDVKLPIDVKIPEDYIQSPRERLRCYRKFFSTGTEDALQRLLAECEDRFGTMPKEVKLLGEIARTRRLALRISATSLVVSNHGTEIRLDPVMLQGGDDSESLVMRILDVCNRRMRDVRLTPDGRILHSGLRASDFKGEYVEKSFAQLQLFLSILAGEAAIA